MKLMKNFKMMLWAACLCIASSTMAAEPAPLFSFHTNIYAEQGISNQFSVLVSNTKPMVLYVDGGNGADVYELETIGDTLIYCSVTEAGNVVISGEKASDAELIDYVSIRGAYVRTIDLSRLTNLNVLDLSHNELQSLDLSHNTKMQAIYVSDNTFTEQTPFIVGEKPNLVILEMQVVDWLDPNFDMTKYPKLLSFDAYHCPTLTKIDPTKCPLLLQLTLEMTNVAALDVSKNDSLIILNISETAIDKIDLTHNKRLQQLFAEHVSDVFNTNTKLTELDVTNCPDLYRFTCNGNHLTELDVTHNPMLIHFSCTHNYLKTIDLSKQYQLGEVNLDYNYLDFATLPLKGSTWETYTYQQRDLPTERSYKEGDVLDFSSRVLRQGTVTDMALYAFDATAPDTWTKLDKTYYTYADGKVTLLKAHADSLLIMFANDQFLEYNLYTEHFMVKTESEYGKPSQVLTFMPAVDNPRYQIGIEGATAENPKTFYIEYYDYNQNKNVQVEQTTTGATLADATWQTLTVGSYSNLTLLIPEKTNITALCMDGLGMSSLDVTKLMGLRELSLANNSLYDIDLKSNRNLRTLNLSGNDLYGKFSLEGINSRFDKAVLTDIDLSDNEISEITLSPLRVILNLNLSNNKLTTLDLANADAIQTLLLAHNQLEDLNIPYCNNLTTLDVSYNNLQTLTLPTEQKLTDLTLHHNYFALTTLPRVDLTEEHYHYAPQADIVIAEKGPCVDLSEQEVTINGQSTVYRWIKEDGTTLVEGTDYTVVNGLTRFINTEAGKVYGAISHAAYPAFAGDDVLKTTLIQVAGMPTHKLAEFVTAADGDVVSLSLAAGTEGTALYIDWEGNDNVTQYVLGTQYRLFTATTHKDKTVRVYTYEPTEAITVFSMVGASLKSFDGSALNDAGNISVIGSGLTSITLPTEKNNLRELSLQDNAFTKIDFVNEYKNLQTLSVTGNNLTSIDLTALPELELAAAATNKLTEVKLNNPNVWFLDLAQNNLESIDLSGVKNVRQLSLGQNLLKTIDVADLAELKALQINNNYFTFQTLPAPKKEYVVYSYHNQAMLDVQVTNDSIVDLSSQAQVGDSITTYTWYLGVPEWNADALMFEGEELFEELEYTLENGVTTFLTSFKGVMCILTNPAFPNLYLYTDLMNVSTKTGVDDIIADATALRVHNRDIIVTTDGQYPVALYAVDGRQVASTLSVAGETVLHAPTAGTYLVRVANKAYKVMIAQ